MFYDDNSLFTAPLSYSLEIPQLWNSSLLEHGNNLALSRRISTITEIEAEKEHEVAQKASNRSALAGLSNLTLALTFIPLILFDCQLYMYPQAPPL